MSAQDVEAIRRLLNAFNRGEFAALHELDPDAELQDEPRIPGAGWNHGHDGAVQWAVKLWESFGQLSFQISEPRVVEEAVIVRWRASGAGKRSGVEVDMDGYCVFTMQLGKVRRVEFYASEKDALQAVQAGPPEKTPG